MSNSNSILFGGLMLKMKHITVMCFLGFVLPAVLCMAFAILAKALMMVAGTCLTCVNCTGFVMVSGVIGFGVGAGAGWSNLYEYVMREFYRR